MKFLIPIVKALHASLGLRTCEDVKRCIEESSLLWKYLLFQYFAIMDHKDISNYKKHSDLRNENSRWQMDHSWHANVESLSVPTTSH
jgi:hypothetical protein